MKFGRLLLSGVGPLCWHLDLNWPLSVFLPSPKPAVGKTSGCEQDGQEQTTKKLKEAPEAPKDERSCSPPPA